MMGFPPLLNGEKTVLRQFTAEDISAEYISWLNDPVVTRFSNQRFRVHDRRSCESYFASFHNTSNMFISIRDLTSGAPIGTMTAYAQPHHGTVDVGIMVGERAAWGKGFGQDAWSTLVNWLIAQPSVRKVTAGTLAINQPMIRLAERSGMKLEGRRIMQEVVDGQPHDILYFGLFAPSREPVVER